MKDGICEFIFRKSSNNFFEFSLDILKSIGYSCINPYFNKIFLWLGGTGDETECSDIAEMHRLLPNEESAALTMWKGTDDIWVETAVSSEFNVLTIDPRLLSPENGQRIIDGIYREISARNYIKNLSRIIIDKSGITEDSAYYLDDKFRIGLADNFEKYFLKITEFYVMNKKDFPSTVHCLDDVVYYFDFGHSPEEFCAKIFVLNDT